MGFTGGRKLRSVIFIIIESVMGLLVIQVAQDVLLIIGFGITSMNGILTWQDVYTLIVPIHKMLDVITSSVIVILYFTDAMDLARV